MIQAAGRHTNLDNTAHECKSKQSTIATNTTTAETDSRTTKQIPIKFGIPGYQIEDFRGKDFRSIWDQLN